MMPAPLSISYQRQLKDKSWRGPGKWAQFANIELRPYQAEISHAIVNSIINKLGRTFVVVLPRQSGKNELQAHLCAWLLFRFARDGGRIVSVSPTFKPQTINAMDRVRHSLDRNPASLGRWKSSAGYIFKIGASRLQFYSGEPTAKVVGATADLLLSVDEAQDVDANKFDKEFDPMTASTNATRVFWGTVWTSDTLLARQMKIAQQEEKADGVKRLFFYTADDVRKLVPSYGEKVDAVIREKGRQHPMVKTQYFCETLDAQAGMFNEGRLALMQGDQPAQNAPTPGHVYAFCIDVAGMDEALLNLDGMGNPGRDSTTLSIIDVDLTTLEILRAPVYRVVRRFNWQGVSHLQIFSQLAALAASWHPQHIILDATGVGEGLWALLDKAFPERVTPVKFTAQSKSEIGYGFLGIIETGRFRDCDQSDNVLIQYKKCTSEILPGPQHTMRWGVKDGTRGPSGELIHDDYILADALTSKLDEMEWIAQLETSITQGTDPLEEMDRNF